MHSECIFLVMIAQYERDHEGVLLFACVRLAVYQKYLKIYLAFRLSCSIFVPKIFNINWKSWH